MTPDTTTIAAFASARAARRKPMLERLFPRAAQSAPRIEFVCAPEDLGVIAEPAPARTALPDWFRKLPPIDQNQVGARDNGLTIKRCMPFLDAMTTGWILPVAATVRLEIRDGGRTCDAGWEFDKTMISSHHAYQIAGHPALPRPPCKLHNHWVIKTPPGWSCLFVPALNREQDVIRVLAGVVDTDSYQSLINFPFIPIAPDGVYTLEKGTPLVQVIPFRRETTTIEGAVRAETAEERETNQRILRNTQAAEGWYRRQARAKR
jgi:hypothetical protein